MQVEKEAEGNGARTRDPTLAVDQDGTRARIGKSFLQPREHARIETAENVRARGVGDSDVKVGEVCWVQMCLLCAAGIGPSRRCPGAVRPRFSAWLHGQHYRAGRCFMSRGGRIRLSQFYDHERASSSSEDDRFNATFA